MAVASQGKPVVLIGLTSHKGDFCPDMLSCLDRLVKTSLGAGVGLKMIKSYGAMIAQNRNEIVKKALEENADYVLFIDSDMTFNDDFLIDLLKHDRDIVSALCVGRVAPYRPVAKVLKEDGRYFPREGLHEGRFFADLDAVGAAFLLVKVDVFRKMEPPWFAMPPYKTGIMGEDVYFCRKAKEMGYDICLDSALHCGHLGLFSFTMDNHLDYMAEHKDADLAFD